MKKIIAIALISILFSCEKNDEVEIKKSQPDISGEYYSDDFCDYQLTLVLDKKEGNNYLLNSQVFLEFENGKAEYNTGSVIVTITIINPNTINMTQKKDDFICESDFVKK